jgi:hypothetical protein
MQLSVLLLQPLGPALILAAGGLALIVADWLSAALAVGRGVVGPRPGGVWRTVVMPACGLLTVAAALVAAVQLRAAPAPTVLHWTWQPLTVVGGVVEWRLDGWSWLAALLLLVLTATALAIAAAGGPSVHKQTGRTLWLGAAGLAFVAADNVIALAAAWVAFDGALLWRLGADRRSSAAGRAWGWLSIAGFLPLLLLALLGEAGLGSRLAVGPFNELELALLWLSALIRAGVYPLHAWLGPAGGDRGERFAAHLLAPLPGLWLMGRVHGSATGGWLQRPEWAALAALGLLGSALAAWAAGDSARRWQWIAINRASIATMAAYMTAAVGPQAVLWAALSFALGGGLLAVGQAALAKLGWRWPLWLAALTLWGAPGTLGFLARAILVFPTELPVAIPLFGLVLVAESLLAAALWQMAAEQRRASGPAQASSTRALATWLGLPALLLAALALTGGLFPSRLADLLGLPPEAFPSLPQALMQARRSVWIGLALAGAVGVALGTQRQRIFGRLRGWQEGLVAVVSLDWFYRLAGATLTLVGSGLRYFASLGEGEGYLGWLMLAGLILWVLLWG